MKFISPSILGFIFLASTTVAQPLADSSSIDEVTVKGYFSDRPILKAPSSVSIVSSATLQNQAPYTLVPALNTVPGVRMEERSPGSYRLSIRGSLLRSPFGVRNVKIYFDDFMLTDAGGNTYLNLLDAGSTSAIEVLKGPEGSIYGANTGGVVLVRPFQKADSLLLAASITGGSYGTYQQKFSFQHKGEKFQLGIHQALFGSKGYRQQSDSERKYIHLTPQFRYSPKGSLKGLFLFSDLNYQTPGGLTQAQYEENPRNARQQAIDQRTEIFNKTFLGGISHQYQLSDKLRHVVALTASGTDFKNPFVTNYELRDEHSAGIRTYLEFASGGLLPLEIQLGYEGQQTSTDLQNYENLAGRAGEQQEQTDLRANQQSGFLRMSAEPSDRLSIEAALGLNKFSFGYEGFFPEPTPYAERDFKVQLMPRAAASYQIAPGLAVRASLSKGFSAPTLEEVNPSGSRVNTLLQAEGGWNREAGLRVSMLDGRIYWDAVYFNFRLKNAIVRGVNPDETDYYVNAGSTRQRGFESELSIRVLSFSKARPVRSLILRNSLTVNRFRFGNYINGENDFSGKRLTGVPRSVVVSSIQAVLPANLDLFLQHNFTSSIPVNDANTVFADKYHLLGTRLSWKYPGSNLPLGLFAGADNLLDQKYSLGNDLNALGNRYFNAAPGRNFYLGLSFGY